MYTDQFKLKRDFHANVETFPYNLHKIDFLSSFYSTVLWVSLINAVECSDPIKIDPDLESVLYEQMNSDPLFKFLFCSWFLATNIRNILVYLDPGIWNIPDPGAKPCYFPRIGEQDGEMTRVLGIRGVTPITSVHWSSGTHHEISKISHLWETRHCAHTKIDIIKKSTICISYPLQGSLFLQGSNKVKLPCEKFKIIINVYIINDPLTMKLSVWKINHTKYLTRLIKINECVNLNYWVKKLLK